MFSITFSPSSLPHMVMGIALLSSVCAAGATLLARSAMQQLSARDTVGISFLLMSIALLLVSPVFYYFDATPFHMSLIVLIGLIDSVANHFYFSTLEHEHAQSVVPFLSLAPVISFMGGWLVFGNTLSLQSTVLCIGIIVLIVLFSLEKKSIRTWNKPLVYSALLSSTLYGLSIVPAKYLLTNLEAINAPTLYMYRCAFIAIFSLLFFHFNFNNLHVKQYRLICLRGLIVLCQWILLYYALSLGSIGIVLTLASVTPILVFLINTPVQRKKPNRQQLCISFLVISCIFFLVLS